ncbi:hypothetical protein D3C78_18810 [compost metagenome]
MYVPNQYMTRRKEMSERYCEAKSKISLKEANPIIAITFVTVFVMSLSLPAIFAILVGAAFIAYCSVIITIAYTNNKNAKSILEEAIASGYEWNEQNEEFQVRRF